MNTDVPNSFEAFSGITLRDGGGRGGQGDEQDLSGGGDGCVRVVLYITFTCPHEREFTIAEGVNADRYQCNVEDLQEHNANGNA